MQTIMDGCQILWLPWRVYLSCELSILVPEHRQSRRPAGLRLTVHDAPRGLLTEWDPYFR